MSIEDICRAIGRTILKEICLENFEKSIVEKGSPLPTNDNIETGTRSSSRVPKLGSFQRDKTW